MSLYYKQKLISGVRDVPSMTLAQYNALTNKPKLWIRTDAPEGDRGINADDIEYSNGVSVKKAIDGVLVKSIPANTYNTYALALAELENYFDNLTDDEKRRSKVLIGTNFFNYFGGVSKTYGLVLASLDSGAVKTSILGVSLANHTWLMQEIKTSITSTNLSSNAQAVVVALYVD